MSGHCLIGCEGACDEHIGDVVLVHVWQDDPLTDWGEFCYCEEAIREDRSRGLRVEIVTPNDCPHTSAAPADKVQGLVGQEIGS